MNRITTVHSDVKLDSTSKLIFTDANDNECPIEAYDGKIKFSTDAEFNIGESTTSISDLTDYRIIYPSGEWQMSSIYSSPVNRFWRNVCYGNGKYVAVTSSSQLQADDGRITSYSLDGKIWTRDPESYTSDKATQWTSVAYGDGLYVIVSYANNNKCYALSTDGIHWTYKTGLPVANCYGICFKPSTDGNKGIFMVATSDQHGSIKGVVNDTGDDIIWSLIPYENNSLYDCRDVCYGNGRFIMTVGNTNSTICKVLLDGSDAWQDMTISTTAKKWRSIAYGNGRFVMVANPRSAAYLRDEDDSWTFVNISIESKQWFSVAYGNNIFVAFENPSTVTDVAAYSMYGDAWTLTKLPVAAKWWCVAYGEKGFVAVAQNSMYVIHSDDGISWYEYQLPLQDLVPEQWLSCCSGGDQFVLVASGSSQSAYSIDGSNWTKSTMIGGGPYEWVSVAFGKGRFIAIERGGTNKAAYTFNGKNWIPTQISSPEATRSWNCICYGRDRFVAVQGNTDENNRYVSNIAAYSIDGITWIETPLKDSGVWTSVCYGNSKFVCIGYGSDGTNSYPMINYSVDGITWDDADVSGLDSLNWYGICYNIDKYVMLANGSTYAAYSSDGLHWTQVKISANSQFWRSVCYGNGRFVAVANKTNVVAFSIDGILWNEFTIDGLTQIRNCVCYGNGRFVMPVGNSSTVYYIDMSNKYSKRLDQLSQLIFQRLYPVGSIYLSAENINPKVLLGFGDWQRITGRFLFTNDTGSGTTGGELMRSITFADLPTYITSSTTDATSPTADYTPGKVATTVELNGSTSAGRPFSIMPPYYTVYAWRRVW